MERSTPLLVWLVVLLALANGGDLGASAAGVGAKAKAKGDILAELDLEPAQWLAEQGISVGGGDVDDVSGLLASEGIESVRDLAQLDDNDLKALGIKKRRDRAKFAPLREKVIGSRGSGKSAKDVLLDAPIADTTAPSKEHYAGARQAAKEWLMDLDVDPQVLVENGIKGKKKLAEYLDAMKCLIRDKRSTEEEKEQVRGRLQEVLDAALVADYHNLRTCGDKEFDENSMSYLRVLQILRSLDFDQFYAEYRKQLLLAKPRLDARMAHRGPWQRDAFRQYYLQFSLRLPAVLKPDAGESETSASPDGVIKRQVLEMTKDDIYRVTHEVFVAFDYGEKHDQDSFDDRDLFYLRSILPQLAKGLAAEKDWDLLAEIVSCMNYLHDEFRETPEFTESVRKLLNAQNADGTWGDYEEHRGRFGDFLDHHLYLHTTMVTLRALDEHFSGEWGGSP